ncbi:MAG TPA: ThuA domain-containing protein [Candidatus Sulfotelmatobacter sp.]|nr:ThuA domain-containing protein [Candidatus Sulfotelmatobacter sp.]
MRIGRVALWLWIATQLIAVSFGQQARFKVLAFYSDKTEPDHVRFAQDAVNFLSERAASDHFAFEATTRWEDLNDQRLKDCQLVVWLNESPSNAEQRSAFERYIEHGGAWLGFHAAGYNDKDTNWPWFVDFLGGAVFDINSWPPLPARVVIDDRMNPVMAGLPTEFESPSNEWYIWKPSPRVNKDVRVLATFDASNYPIGFKDVLTSGDLPVVWSNTKYKMLYMNMGHGDKIFTSPVQNQLIVNAVNWLGSGAPQPPMAGPVGIRISTHGIAVNSKNGKFYAVNTREGSVAVLDGDGRFLTRVAVGMQPESIAINPETNRVYITNGGSGRVSVIDGATDKLAATVPVGDLPYTITVNQATNKVYVSRTFSDVTVIIDGKTNTADTVKAGVGDAVDAASLDNDTYMFSYETRQVTVFDGTNDHVSTISSPDHLWTIVANPRTKKLYAASVGNGNVMVIDGKSHTAKTVNTGGIPGAVAIDSAANKVFVANYAANNVAVIDGAIDAVIATVDVGAGPQAVTVDTSNHRVYVSSLHSGTVSVLDGTGNSLVRTIEIGKAPFALAVNSKTHKAVALGLQGQLTVIDGTSLTTSSPFIP